LALRVLYPDLLVLTERPSWFKWTDDYRYDSDVTRIRQLCKPGEWHYLDIDTVVEKDFKPPSMDKPWFAHNCGSPDICNIFSDKPEFFQRFLAEEQQINTARTFGVFQALLFDNRDKINLIPQGYYTHLNISLRRNGGQKTDPAAGTSTAAANR
jgi:hypothetical protein